MEPLKSFETLTEADGRWAFFRVSLPKLYQIVEEMTLSEDVPERVLVQFQQAQHLLIYSHLQFSLLSVALTQALIAVEFALMTRWKNDTTRPPSKYKSEPGLKKLLEFAFEKDWLQGFDEGLITLIPELRNASAHGEYSLTPIDTLDLAQLCGQLIQKLFPSPVITPDL
ncbi:hypothetical protein HH213_14975 [Duganella dendranthematis]|uniref:DUF4145 domain-containing protein n=1 Tax=Duganella dendranthematis TaxID=2728021 RepID=A0ABX6MAZ2_9BURK|nr:hypothetical protein [Duganella dendranthematis]QJD91261.1 hypothetical protein HH213_14975 [Duganella dendranthematis]